MVAGATCRGVIDLQHRGCVEGGDDGGEAGGSDADGQDRNGEEECVMAG